eukprot:1161199-Pelagomonas_calceolata.AAC.1
MERPWSNSMEKCYIIPDTRCCSYPCCRILLRHGCCCCSDRTRRKKTSDANCKQGCLQSPQRSRGMPCSRHLCCEERQAGQIFTRWSLRQRPFVEARVVARFQLGQQGLHIRAHSSQALCHLRIELANSACEYAVHISFLAGKCGNFMNKQE